MITKEQVRDPIVGGAVLVLVVVGMLASMDAAMSYSSRIDDHIQLLRDCYEDPGCTLSARQLRELRKHEGSTP